MGEWAGVVTVVTQAYSHKEANDHPRVEADGAIDNIAQAGATVGYKRGVEGRG